MTDTDDAIAKALLAGDLSADDREFLNNLEADRGMFRQIGDSWKGPMGGWAKLIFAFTTVMGVLMLFTLWRVIHTSNPIEHTLWAIAGLGALIIVGFAKEWMFARMNMLTILREVKKLQVQVAILSEKQD